MCPFTVQEQPRLQETRDAPHQTAKSIHVEPVGPAEIVEDLDAGLPRQRVPVAVGQLHVFEDLVLFLDPDSSKIHCTICIFLQFFGALPASCADYGTALLRKVSNSALSSGVKSLLTDLGANPQAQSLQRSWKMRLHSSCTSLPSESMMPA